MMRCTKIAAVFSFLLASAFVDAAFAADKPLFACADGAQTSAPHLCDGHGGFKGKVQAPKNASTPIDTTKGLTPPDKNATTKSKSSTQSASTAHHKKAASKATGSPTARCNDGAMYYSTEHKGACLSHGGVDKWYIW